MSSDVDMTDTSHISSLLSGMVEKLKILKRKVQLLNIIRYLIYLDLNFINHS